MASEKKSGSVNRPFVKIYALDYKVQKAEEENFVLIWNMMIRFVNIFSNLEWEGCGNGD